MNIEITHEQLLEWSETLGIGYYPCPNGLSPYDRSYWDKYVGYAATELGAALTRARIELLLRHVGPEATVLDIGIGCGQFVEAWGEHAWGFDVNPVGIEWLIHRGRWLNPYASGVFQDVVTCWDSLEHVRHPDRLLEHVPRAFACALPIFESREHILHSKHFRPDEHFWYWTERGFLSYMDSNGFEAREANRIETTLGREDIGSFLFVRRVQPPTG